MTREQIIKVLKIIEDYDLQDGGIDWVVEDEDVKFLANCSDIFIWATADCEPIESVQDINFLQHCIDNCVNNIGEDEDGMIDDYKAACIGIILYCAWKRRLRPQGAVYNKIIPKKLWGLFNVCGPEREVGFGNPQEVEKY